ncbi:hypothetical protein EVAR_29105_1 [Eumeta japonica]|uniref:Uncharacterized protein n=1 Tax=Eumeta variegata TaxID=151549 RepID=A0A4C1VQ18_EUMVA|nr:hypothetical protein EVAR_29105_1 [Eumeta japonica]
MNKPPIRPILPTKSTPVFDSVLVSKAETEQRLQKAIERKDNAIAEHFRLFSLPETGEDFIRNLLPIQRKCRLFSSKIEDINENEPIKFSTSPAAKRQVVENDIDQEFTKTLYERIDGLEKEQLLISYRFNKEHGKSVEDIEKRLKEIEDEEKAALEKREELS